MNFRRLNNPVDFTNPLINIIAMENIPHWRETPAPEARATALRLEKDVHIVAGRPIKSTHLKERADDVARTPGALLIVQLEMSHSAALVMQCREQNRTSDSIAISKNNFPSWGNLHSVDELGQIPWPPGTQGKFSPNPS